MRRDLRDRGRTGPDPVGTEASRPRQGGRNIPTTLAALAVAVVFTGRSEAVPGSTDEDHLPRRVDMLPVGIRKTLDPHTTVCGSDPRAGHYFTVSVKESGREFRALHFDEFACERRSAVCQPEGCLHEIYLVNGVEHRLVFRTYAREIRITNENGTVRVDVFANGRKRVLIWQKSGFMDVRYLSPPYRSKDDR